MKDARRFEELDFGPHPARMGGVRATSEYPNGYGASVIKTPFSYGGTSGLYELAVTKAPDGHLCYDTPITDDVIGNLSEDEITELLEQIYLLRADRDRGYEAE